MLFRGYNGAAFPPYRRNCFLIQRLESMHINYAGGDALFFQLRLRNQRLRHFQSAGDDGDVTAFPVHLGLANFKSILRFIDDCSFRPAGSHVHRTDILGHPVH